MLTIQNLNEKNKASFSAGVFLQSTMVSTRNHSNVHMLGRDLVSYGVYYDGNQFVVRYSRAKTHIPLPRSLQSGDVINIQMSQKSSELILEIIGEDGCIFNKVYGISQVVDIYDFKGGATLGQEQSLHVRSELITDTDSTLLSGPFKSYHHPDHMLSRDVQTEHKSNYCSVCSANGTFSRDLCRHFNLVLTFST